MCPPQKQVETQPIFSTIIFQNKFTLRHTRLSIYIWQTKFSSHKQYLFGLLFRRNVKKTLADQSVSQTFLLYLKKTFPKCVYHWYNLLRWMFFIPCNNWKTLFFKTNYGYPTFDTTTMLLRSLNKCFERSPHFISVISTKTLQCC